MTMLVAKAVAELYITDNGGQSRLESFQSLLPRWLRAENGEPTPPVAAVVSGQHLGKRGD